MIADIVPGSVSSIPDTPFTVYISSTTAIEPRTVAPWHPQSALIITVPVRILKIRIIPSLKVRVDISKIILYYVAADFQIMITVQMDY
jgi:hypothetical protein